MSTPSEGVLTKPTPAVGTLLAVLGVVYGDIGTSLFMQFEQASAILATCPYLSSR